MNGVTRWRVPLGGGGAAPAGCGRPRRVERHCSRRARSHGRGLGERYRVADGHASTQADGAPSWRRRWRLPRRTARKRRWPRSRRRAASSTWATVHLRLRLQRHRHRSRRRHVPGRQEPHRHDGPQRRARHPGARRLARGGSGWLYYTWPNPQHDNVQEPKLGYVEKVDDTWFLGSGTYGAAAVEPPSRAEVKAFVDKAYAYVHKVGKKKAFAAFMKKDGPWFQGSAVRVRRQGRRHHPVLSDRARQGRPEPLEPQGPGRQVPHPHDVQGREDKGLGLGHVQVQQPGPGRPDAAQVHYVRLAGDDWFLGSGTYRPID